MLGSTPEYRTALADLFDEVYVIDHSLLFKEYSDAICGINPGERFLNADWLEVLPSLRGTFDLIATHYTHGNVPYDRRSRFFQSIADALRPHGFLFDTIFNPGVLYDLPQIERRFESAPLNLQTYNDFNAVAVFQCQPIASLGRVDTDAIYDWLESHSATPHFQRLVEATMKLITPRALSWDYDPVRPAESFGYQTVLEPVHERPEVPTSAFAGAVRTVVSKVRHD